MDQPGAGPSMSYTPAHIPSKPAELPGAGAVDIEEEEAHESPKDAKRKPRLSRAAKPAAKPTPEAPEAPAAFTGPAPCVGLPVQFFDGNRIIAATLVRENLTQPGAWDLRTFVMGAGMTSQRSAVRQSEEPKAGHWNHLPALKQLFG
jgi:hypothetical protein